MSNENLPEIPASPLETEPDVWLTAADNRALLAGVLDAAGVELGTYDRRIADWLGGAWEASTVLTVASWIQRAAESGGRSR